jgi:ankyrin repeat protein
MPLPRFVGIPVLSALCAGGLLTPLSRAAEEAGGNAKVEPAAPVTETAQTSARSELLIATMGRDWQKIAPLLAAGADVNAADENGLTPLMAAAIAGHVPTIEALIAAGAPADAVDARVRTALGYAIALHNADAIEALLAHQPKLPEAAKGGDDLAAAALNSGDPQLLDNILRRLPPGLTWTPAARIAFSKALAARDTLVGPLLLAKYAGPPAPDAQCQPLLAYAVLRGDMDQVRALLDFGADPDTTLNDNRDPAFRELISSSYIKYYLDSTKGITVLMLAAGMKKTEYVKVLLERGASRLATTKGKNQLIALYFAAWSDDPETLQALITGAPSKDSMWIDVSLDDQRARFYRDGQLVVNTSVSTGRAGFPTRPGEYVITDKNRVHKSSIYHDASMPFFMRLSCRDFGLHEGVVTGHPASHGCIRLPGNIAQQLFKEVPVGTWVTVRRNTKETAQAEPRKH